MLMYTAGFQKRYLENLQTCGFIHRLIPLPQYLIILEGLCFKDHLYWSKVKDFYERNSMIDFTVMMVSNQ